MFLFLSSWYIAEPQLQLLPEVCGRLLRYGSVCVLLCVFVEEAVIEVYFFQSGERGERTGAMGRGSTLVSLTRQRGHGAKCGTAKALGMI